MGILGYQHKDLEASKNLMDIHLAKMQKAMDSANYPEACSAIRAMVDECNNASRVAMTLSLSSHLNNPERR